MTRSRDASDVGIGARPLQDSFRLSKNNFDLLRLVFATTVCLVHSQVLSGYHELQPVVHYLSSDVAVKAFFVVSGFLIFMSYERSLSVASYTAKRLRRIYPAYFTVIVLCALLLPLLDPQSRSGYFSLSWWEYLFANLAFLNFLQPTLQGVFDANKFPHVNGALWTLKIEVMFYVSVPVFVHLFRRIGYLPVIVGTYLLSIAYAALCASAAQRTGSAIYLEIGRQLPGQLSYFMAGAFLYYYLHLLERHPVYFVLPALAILAMRAIPPAGVLQPLALAVIVVFCGVFLYAGKFGKYGDFSYGVYIVHFPIIQTLLHFGWLSNTPYAFLAATLMGTGLASFLMWHLVEKRFLFRSSHYVASSTASTRTSWRRAPAGARTWRATRR